MKKRKDIVSIYLMFGLILLVIGFSYAFFIYNKTGLYTHTINGGKMKVIYDELAGNNITIENAYPRTDEEALTKGLEFEFTISGYNESDKNIYYQIEMDHGSDITGKTRFLDRDIKLTLYENEEIVLENEIFNNLDNQGIYYGYIEYGTSISTPTINNYMMRVWINDNVYISDTIEDDIDLWDDDDWDWAYSALDYDEFIQIDEGDVDTLSELGISVYTSDEFANSYANFKVNVIANLTGQDIGMLFYDANGGINEPNSTYVTTNMITMEKPVMENMGFLGWSPDPLSEDPEYYSGDTYTGNGMKLYAVYTDFMNVMDVFPSTITDYKNQIIEVNFINEKIEVFEERYENASIKSDLTYDEQGLVLSWLEDTVDGYILYVASEGTTYLNNGYELFKDFAKVREFNFTNLDTSMVTEMTGMFSGIDENLRYSTSEIPENSIKVLDLRGFNTSNVTDMSYMFDHDITLKNIIFGDNFDTSKVTNMSSMFSECGSLLSLDLNFDTSLVTDMGGMFSDCYLLKELELDSFDTSNVTDMSSMFSYCGLLNELDLSSFNTSHVTDMEYMFEKCEVIEKIDVSNFNTSQVATMRFMFSGCNNLTKLDVSKFNTSNVRNMSSMFYECYNLAIIDVSNFNTSNVTDMGWMFSNCRSVKELDLSNFDTTNVTTIESMFSSCHSLETLDLSSFVLNFVPNFFYFCYNCRSLRSIDFSSFDLSSITNYYWAFKFAGSDLPNNEPIVFYVKDEPTMDWFLGLSANDLPDRFSIKIKTNS